MRTIFLLMAQYDARVIVPIELVCRDYFSHLTVAQFVRKINVGEIALPLVRIDASLKSAKGVHIEDLAEWIDERRAAAVKECEQLCGRIGSA
ncbi:pyocin activator PrtN family protein [Burkholderia multivorans]|uniref:pyocin activator PrtN family protein n=1 Tax=Burkholderia multivorans TaxID=87883 RepID=UPI000CFFB597|nr:pyocin activator PrtN family protein [Burkholderia multivorans]MCL4662015.1 pyocin activator PrtN family protein [Burkholderia multivorans]MCO1353448.1 pyocin activator PrtN family protein [Burkholderia multivorans]MCO1412708.1 pyocin activator PrtN family protein [Burkholderia multivorans]MCO1447101.1 pyocin activator PrtN family protein [Burkholderia multivorans]MCO8642673.1 pyocin activator PrtN family protein [Burkholderia multivorans]